MDNIRGIVLMVASMAGFSVEDALIKSVAEDVPTGEIIIILGLIGGLMVAEFAWRSRRFPGRYHGPLDFAKRMAALGPGFWNGLFRDEKPR